MLIHFHRTTLKMNICSALIFLCVLNINISENSAFLTQTPKGICPSTSLSAYDEGFFSDNIVPRRMHTNENAMFNNYDGSSRFGVDDDDTKVLEARLRALQEAKSAALEAQKALHERLEALDKAKREADESQNRLEERLAILAPIRKYGREQSSHEQGRRHRNPTPYQQPNSNDLRKNDVEEKIMSDNINHMHMNSDNSYQDNYARQSYPLNMNMNDNYARHNYNYRQPFEEGYGPQMWNQSPTYDQGFDYRQNHDFFNAPPDFERFNDGRYNHFDGFQSNSQGYFGHPNHYQARDYNQARIGNQGYDDPYNEEMRARMNGEW